MSYHVEFHARDRHHARRYLAQTVAPSLPEDVHAQLQAMLGRLSHDGPVYVHASGHLASGKNGDLDSVSAIEVRARHLITVPEPHGHEHGTTEV